MAKLPTAAHRNRVALVGIAAFAVSFVAAAQPAAQQLGTGGTVSKSKSPPALAAFAGSSLSYSHSASAFTFAPGAEPYYNPTWSHRLGILPQARIGPQFVVRGRIFLSQEFTLSDYTQYRHEVEVSDASIDLGLVGVTEPFTRIHVGGDVRIGFPISKISQAQTRVLTTGLGVVLSRPFEVLAGLRLAYIGRYNYRFHRYTTGQLQGASIAACGDPRQPECAEFITTGARNAHSDLTHGPSISFSPHERVSINTSFIMSHLWLYPLNATPPELQGSTQLDDPANPDNPLRQFTNFDLGVSVTLTRPLTLTLGASTFSPWWDTTGTRYFPLFNRNTTLYLDLSVDVEAAISSFL